MKSILAALLLISLPALATEPAGNPIKVTGVQINGTPSNHRAGAFNLPTGSTWSESLKRWTISGGGGTGVTSAVAGSGISVSGATGAVTFSINSAVGALLSGAQLFTGAKTFNHATLLINNAGDAFAHTLASSATAARTWTLPDATATAAGLGIAQTFTKSQNVASVAVTDASSIATDASLGNVFTVTITGNRTLANPTNLVSGGTYIWIITQDGTGSRTLAYGSLFAWPSGTAPTLSLGASSVDLITAVYDGTKLRAVATKDIR